MGALLKIFDDQVWVIIEKRLKMPILIVEGVEAPKDTNSWSKYEINECNWNCKCLNTIFVAISS